MENYFAELDFEWFQRMNQFFRDDAKYNPVINAIEFTEEDFEIDNQGKTVAIAPIKKKKDLIDFCWSYYYPGNSTFTFENIRSLPHGTIIDGKLIVEDLIPSTIAGYFGDFENDYADVDNIVGAHNYEPLYRFIKKAIAVAEDQVNSLKATDQSEKGIYSEILDYINNKLRRYLYDKYSRVIGAFSFIHGDNFMMDMRTDFYPISKAENSTEIHEYLECFKGKWNGTTILNEKDYHVVMATTIAFIKEWKIPLIQKKISISCAPKEFIKRTYFLLYKKYRGERRAWVNLLAGLFEQFPQDEIESTYKNFSRYLGDYVKDKARIQI